MSRRFFSHRPDEVTRTKLAESGQVAIVGFSRDGSRLLVVIQEDFPVEARQATYVIWSIPEQQIVQWWSIPGLDKCADISPDGETVVTGHEDGTLRFWNVADPRESSNVSFEMPIYAVAYSPDGQLVAVGNTALHLVNASNREVIANMPLASVIHSIDFSDDGRRIATGGGEEANAVKIWDVETRQELMTLAIPGYSFRQVEYSPDNNSVMLIGGLDFLKVWHAPTLAEIDAEQDLNP